MSSEQVLRHAWQGLASVLLAASVLVSGCGDGGDAAKGTAEPSADFRVASLDGGGPLGPPDYAGKVVLLDFWATWCVPCHAQARILRSVHDEVAGDGVQFLAVDVGEDPEIVREFVAENPFPYPVLIDPEDELSLRLGIIGLPTLMVVDRRGRVTYFRTGILDGDGVRRVLAEAGA